MTSEGLSTWCLDSIIRPLSAIPLSLPARQCNEVCPLSRIGFHPQTFERRPIHSAFGHKLGYVLYRDGQEYIQTVDGTVLARVVRWRGDHAPRPYVSHCYGGAPQPYY